MLEFYIVPKSDVEFCYPFLPRIALHENALFSFYADGKNFYMVRGELEKDQLLFNNIVFSKAKGKYKETDDTFFCEVELPTFYR